jgi:Uncharacterized conserved protein (DUF2285)
MPSQYPDPADTTLHRWAWEFLWRNPKFQSEFEAAESAQLALEATGALPLAWNERPIGALAWRWGIRRISFIWPGHEKTPVELDVAPRALAHVRIRGREQWIVAAPERPDRMAFEFDLAAPIDPQLERARRALLTNQKLKFPAQNRQRVQPEKLRDYLRVLDATQADATTREMLDVFSAERADALDAKVLNRWKHRALELRDGGYRGLLAL